MALTRREIAERIEEIANLNFEGRRFGEALRAISWTLSTRSVKQAFGNLGKQLGYQVAASGYSGADEGEWLYDMVWFTSREGLLRQQAMVLESEFKPGGSVLQAAAVDGDFMKLVQARAEVRVWFALIPNPELAAQHIKNCKSQASAFEGAVHGDTYVLIVFDWTTSNTIVERFEIDYGVTKER